MNNKTLRILEYNKIIDLLTEQATSDAGREICHKLKPMTDLADIQQAQQETADALTHIYQKGNLSFYGLSNPEGSLKRLEIGGTLNIKELLAICKLLEIARQAKAYYRDARGEVSADSLQDYFGGIEPLTPLQEEIRRCIIDEEEISDDASPVLHDIRRQMKVTNDRIHGVMSNILNNSNTRTYLQDTVITMRNDRYCLPVKAEYKNQVPGMIHDQSSTGSTLFIEPMSVVRLNNDLKELFLREKEEIQVILANLSNLTAEYIPYLRDDYKLLSGLDFIFARAKLAHNQNAMKPEFNTNGYIRIRQGRHPLLDAKKAVPIDVYLGDAFNLLIVTGPNTGGKDRFFKNRWSVYPYGAVRTAHSGCRSFPAGIVQTCIC